MANGTTASTDEPQLYPKAAVQQLVPLHDAILPYPFQGVDWAIPNLGDNVETENASMAELFETIGRNLLTVSNMRDCFVVNPPSIAAVKAHHNMYVRLLRFIDARTKTDTEERLDFAHVSPHRRVFRIYPVRYFDMKNRWTKRWVELYIHGLTNIAQMAEANTWTNDWGVVSSKEMKRPFREAYRLMAVELFDANLDAAKSLDFLLTQADFDTYNVSATIPIYEHFDHPYTAFFTEDRLRRITTPTVPIGQGIDETGGNTISPGETTERDNAPIIQ